MHGRSASKATLRSKEDIGVSRGEEGQGVERLAVYLSEDGGGEGQVAEETDPVDSMPFIGGESRHGKTKYSTTSEVTLSLYGFNFEGCRNGHFAD
jgi:hypothetical protein